MTHAPEKLRILNCKSFRDSGFKEFGPGFNDMVGQNNSGKTAFLLALGLHSGENKPHKRSEVPNDQPPDSQSHFEFEIEASGNALLAAALRVGRHVVQARYGHLDFCVF